MLLESTLFSSFSTILESDEVAALLVVISYPKLQYMFETCPTLI